MKMEIKHLAPYLPYDIKVVFEADEHKHTLVGLVNWSDEIMVLSPFNDYGRSNIKNCKPILRPLSNLTKEIKHNGEKFLPMEKLREIYTERLCFDKNGFYYHIGESLVRGKAHDTHFPFNQLEAYSYLFEWHFDVFNLHENGLCIYYNELKH